MPAPASAPAARARAWRHARHAAICDIVRPWAHGTVVRTTRWPLYYQYNLVRVEEDPAMALDELLAFADQALAGLEHRRIDIEPDDCADALRRGFAAAGWHRMRALALRYEAAPPPRQTIPAVQPVA